MVDQRLLSGANVRQRLAELLVANLYGDDLKRVKNGKLVGLPDKKGLPEANRNFGAQRGLRFI